jgi:hypothetical protein
VVGGGERDLEEEGSGEGMVTLVIKVMLGIDIIWINLGKRGI